MIARLAQKCLIIMSQPFLKKLLTYIVKDGILYLVATKQIITFKKVIDSVLPICYIN